MADEDVSREMERVVDGALALGQDQSLSFVLPDGTAGFVVRRGTGFVAFENRCPHWGVDLDMGFGDFVDPRSGLIACRNHLAAFDPDSGLCIAGPCVGDRLVPLEVVVESSRVRVRRPR